MVKCAIILLHLGYQDNNSKKILDKLESEKISGISKILVSNSEVKDWLKHNTKNVVITKLPAFLVAYEGKDTRVYPGDAIDDIINLLSYLK